MADEESGGSEDLPEDGFQLERSFVVSVAGDAPNHNYPILLLHNDSPEKCSECVAVTRVDGKILLAVPDPAWHRKKVQRVIASAALTKAVRATCVGCPAGARTDAEGEPTLKIWLDLLASEMEYALTDDAVAQVTFPIGSDGAAFVPFAPALVAIAQDHFTFQTAQEGEDPTMTSRRLDRLEDGLAQILLELGKMKAPAAPKLVPTPKASKAAKPAPAAPGLSNALVHQALQAGVSQAALAEIGGMLGNQAAAKLDPLAVPDQKELTSDEEEALYVDPEDAGAVSDPVGRAVLHLSKIVTEIHQEKRRKKDRGLESILDNADLATPEIPPPVVRGGPMQLPYAVCSGCWRRTQNFCFRKWSA